MTTDIKELLTYAAKSIGLDCGYEFVDNPFFTGIVRRNYENGFELQAQYWCPHTDDGDSARLRTTLGINVKWYADEVMVFVPTPLTFEERFYDHSGDKNAALRWATLRLAAEIGRRME